MNPNLQQLQAYPFEKLAALKHGITPQTQRKAVLLSVGEPRHAPPQCVLDSLAENLGGLASTPVPVAMTRCVKRLHNGWQTAFN